VCNISLDLSLVILSMQNAGVTLIAESAESTESAESAPIQHTNY